MKHIVLTTGLVSLHRTILTICIYSQHGNSIRDSPSERFYLRSDVAPKRKKPRAARIAEQRMPLPPIGIHAFKYGIKRLFNGLFNIRLVNDANVEDRALRNRAEERAGCGS